MESIYAEFADKLPIVMQDIVGMLEERNLANRSAGGEGLYEHLQKRIKSDASMREKCRRRGLPETAESALAELTDAVGLRVVVRFLDDIQTIRRIFESSERIRIVAEKDYITQVKPNGYRGFHLILALSEPFEDVRGNIPGTYYAEVQLRTIAQDVWASLEHELKYKHDIGNASLVQSELLRCADGLASCDVQMQTIRTLIESSKGDAQ
ncbi:GTP pyrophosphokinase [Curtanaerobium respiraculi]|jgi:GTP pyrophosphokinase|uniref:GTP pyrophosphokinase n=1 Tax=Curtanaerobium respiraculi TaxID=2949669 RepID=UPI0024B3C81F|nr:GTP pyrophosphokinase family protein [Curtanaerobium respiraculi]